MSYNENLILKIIDIFKRNSNWKKKINQQEKKKVDVGSLRGNYKEFIKSIKLILKLQQRFRNKKYDVLSN